MTFPSVIYPPNRPLERQLEPSKVPVQYDHCFFIDSNDKGEFVIGSSSITASYWEGVLGHYKNYAATLNNDYCGYYISTSSTADAKFLRGTNRVVLAEDSGHLKLLTLDDVGDPNLKCVDVFNVNARIEQIAVWNKSSKVVTCANKTIEVWDMDAQNQIRSNSGYRDYHTECIVSIDANKNQSNLFASASMDRKVCTWDERMEMPAIVLYENGFGGMMSVCWNESQPLHLAAGSRDGVVYNLDMRKPKQFVSHHYCFAADVHRILFNEIGHLAVCGDTSELLVMDSQDNYKIIYKSEAHTGFVRGLTWLKNALYSCGFDRKIIQHLV